MLGSDEALVGPQVTITRMTFDGEASEIGQITVPLIRENLDFVFLNAVADFNRDGLFSPYETPEGTQDEWVIRNVAVTVTNTDYSRFFSLLDPAVTQGSAVNIRVVVSRTAVAEGGGWNGLVPGDATSLDVVANVSLTDSPMPARPEPNSVGAGGAPMTRLAGPMPVRAVMGVPPQDLDTPTLFSRPSLTDATQGQNTCVAHSIANSLDWLARKHGFEDKLKTAADNSGVDPYEPGTHDGVSSLGWAILDAYVNLGLYTPAAGIKGKEGEAGFTPANEQALKENILAGKNKFVSDNQLPVETTILDDADASKIFGLIKEALRDECAVEVLLRVTDEHGNDVGGHIVSVAGFADIPAGELGSEPHRTIVFHDPQTETTRDLYNLGDDPSKIQDLPFVGRDNEMKLRNAQMVFAVKECHKPVRTSCADFSTTDYVAVVAIPTGIIHLEFSGDPLTNNLLSFSANSPVTVTGAPPFVDVTGEGTFANGVCSFSATGRGTVAGFPNVSVQMTGTVSEDGISGTYVMGVNGELPGGEPITFVFE